MWILLLPDSLLVFIELRVEREHTDYEVVYLNRSGAPEGNIFASNEQDMGKESEQPHIYLGRYTAVSKGSFSRCRCGVMPTPGRAKSYMLRYVLWKKIVGERSHVQRNERKRKERILDHTYTLKYPPDPLDLLHLLKLGGCESVILSEANLSMWLGHLYPSFQGKWQG